LVATKKPSQEALNAGNHDLNTIFRHSDKASMLARYVAEKDGKLDDFARNLLVDAIIEYYVQKTMHITPDAFKRLTLEIITKFPEEVEVCLEFLFLKNKIKVLFFPVDILLSPSKKQEPLWKIVQ
jgi:hypothetical protein